MTGVQIGKTIYVYRKGNGWKFSEDNMMKANIGNAYSHFDNFMDCLNHLGSTDKAKYLKGNYIKVELPKEVSEKIKEVINNRGW